jgi:hypothetical protein
MAMQLDFNLHKCLLRYDRQRYEYVLYRFVFFQSTVDVVVYFDDVLCTIESTLMSFNRTCEQRLRLISSSVEMQTYLCALSDRLKCDVRHKP